ncbi:MAG: hypothetical protein GY856_09320 [bacterium]|nr:hypothetical protein [bacterium]
MTEYFVDDDGVVDAELPDACVIGHESKTACNVVEHHRRSRVTGPKHELIVARCGPHARAFTLYPLGYTPYSRAPLVHRAPDGMAADEAPGETLFSAASDVAAGTRWPESDPHLWRTGGVRTTQRRRVLLTMLLLGVAVTITAERRASVARAVEIPFTRLRDRSREAVRGALEILGGLVKATLDEAHCGTRDLLWRLLASGEIVGQWGPVWILDPTTRGLRSASRPYRPMGQAASRAPP